MNPKANLKKISLDIPKETVRKRSPQIVLMWTAWVMVFVLGGVLGLREIVSPDIGFHLATARWILEHGAMPQTDAFTYTVGSHAYIDLQWIFQLLVYGLHQIGGGTPIVAVTVLLTCLFGGTLLFRTRLRCGVLPTGALLMLLLFFLANLWETRPHLFSWLYGSLILLVLETYSRGNRRWLPALPVIMLLWVNTHSLFVLGLVIIGTYGFSEMVMQKGKVSRPLLIWALAAGAACLLNPYHINGLLFPLIQLRDIQASGAFKSPLTGIGEFASPFGFEQYMAEGRFVLFQPRLFWQLYTLFALIGLAANGKKNRLVDLILFAGFLYIFWRANKNFGYFVMVSFPVAAGGLSMLAQRLRKKAALKTGARISLSAVSLLLCALVLNGSWYALAWDSHHIGTGFNRAVLPVEACAFINRNHIKGRILNSWDDGGYIAWTTRQPVFIYSHGEIMGPDFYEYYVNSKQPQHFARMLQTWKPTVALVGIQTAPYWLYWFDRAGDWRLVFSNERTALFLHRSVAPHVPALPRPAAGKDYPLYDRTTVEQIITRAASMKGPGPGDWLKGSRAYPRTEMQKSSFYLQTAELDACIGTALQGQKNTDFIVPDLMLNLGHAFNARKVYRLADICFDAFLKADNDPLIAKEIEAARRSR